MTSNEFAYLREFDTTKLDSQINGLIGKSIKATGKISNNKTEEGFQIIIIDLEVNDKNDTDVVPEIQNRLRKRGKQTQNDTATPVKQ